jgi:sortase A
MKRIATALIVIGLIVAAYPLLEQGYVAVWQWRVMRQWQRSQVSAGSEATSDYQRLEGLLDKGDSQPDGSAGTDAGSGGTGTGITPPAAEPTPPPPTLGMLTIPRIELKVPILANTTRAALTLGVGQIKGTSALGSVGNAGLAGHRRYFFRRLDELQVGDEIDVATQDESFIYRVYDKKIVEPSDVSVLNRDKANSILTLVTCHPMETFRQRLIIHAVRVEK